MLQHGRSRKCVSACIDSSRLISTKTNIMITWLIIPFWLFWRIVLRSGYRPTYKHDSSWQRQITGNYSTRMLVSCDTCVYPFLLCKQMHLCTHLATPVGFEWHWQQAKSSLSFVSKFSSICAVENKEYYIAKQWVLLSVIVQTWSLLSSNCVLTASAWSSQRRY